MQSAYTRPSRPTMMSAALFAASFVYLLLVMTRTLGVYDEGIVLYGAARVYDGDVPYRDFWTNYGPAQYYVLAGLFKLFGPSVVVERIWDTVMRCGIAVMVFRQVGKEAPLGLALGASGIALLWLGSFAFFGFPVFPSLFFCLVSIALLSDYLYRNAARAPLFWSGVAVGVAALFRHDMGFFTLIAECTLLLARELLAGGAETTLRQRVRGIVLTLLPIVAGAAIVVLPVAVALFVAVPAADLWRALIVFPATIYAKVRGLPFPDLPNPSQVLSGTQKWPALLESLWLYFPLVVGGIGLTLFALIDAPQHRRRMMQGGDASSWAMLLYALLAPALFLKGIVRIQPIHLVQAFIPAVILLAMLIERWRRSSRRARWPSCAVALLAALALARFPLGASAMQVSANLDFAVHRGMVGQLRHSADVIEHLCDPVPGLERARCFLVDADMAATLGYLAVVVPPGDPIFVGNSRHDRVFAGDALLYFLADRRAPTKYFDMVPGLLTTEPIQREIVARLEERKVRFFVECKRWEDVLEPNESSVSSGVDVLDRHISETFVPVAQFGVYRIFQRRKQETPP